MLPLRVGKPMRTMKHACKYLLTLLLLLLTAAGHGLRAQTMSADDLFHDEGRRRRMRLRTEWMLFAGATMAEWRADSGTVTFDPKVGWHIGFDMGLLFSRRCAVVPELRFTHTAVGITGRAGGVARVKSNVFEFPLTFEYRILRGRLRFHAGPSFTLMDRCGCTYAGEATDGLRVRPTVTWVAGVRGIIGRRVMLGVRFNGQFNRTEQIMGRNFDDADYESYRLGGWRLSVSAGYRF